MVLKIFKAVWFLSVLAALANLLYIYAGLSENVVIRDDGVATFALGRDMFFYCCLAFLTLINALVYGIKAYTKAEDFRAWFHGLVITFNIFFIVAFSLIRLFNSGEDFNYGQIGFVIYGSVGLVVCWAISWPVVRILRGSNTKQAV